MSHAYHVKIATESAEATPSSIPFSVGNPTVEHITGMLHLYKRQDGDVGHEVRACATAATRLRVAAIV